MTKLNTNQQAKFDKVCKRIAKGQSLRKACKGTETPSKSTVLQWLVDDKTGTLSDQYARARETQADHYFDQVIEIADKAKDARLQVDARKWVAGKLRPKKYSDKIDLNLTGSMTVNIASDDADGA